MTMYLKYTVMRTVLLYFKNNCGRKGTPNRECLKKFSLLLPCNRCEQQQHRKKLQTSRKHIKYQHDL